MIVLRKYVGAALHSIGAFFRFLPDNLFGFGVFAVALISIFVIALFTTFMSDVERAASRTAYDQNTDFKVYCVSKSGEVLFDGQVANAVVNNGVVEIRARDYAHDFISVIGDCKLTPVNNQ